MVLLFPVGYRTPDVRVALDEVLFNGAREDAVEFRKCGALVTGDD